jgi:hypothetical protein
LTERLRAATAVMLLCENWIFFADSNSNKLQHLENYRDYIKRKAGYYLRLGEAFIAENVQKFGTWVLHRSCVESARLPTSVRQYSLVTRVIKLLGQYKAHFFFRSNVLTGGHDQMPASWDIISTKKSRSQEKFLNLNFVGWGVFFIDTLDGMSGFALTLPETLYIGDPISTAAGLVMVVITLILVQKKADSKPPRSRPPRRKRDKTREKLAALEEAERLRQELKKNGRPEGACDCGSPNPKPVGLWPTLTEHTSPKTRWKILMAIIRSIF